MKKQCFPPKSASRYQFPSLSPQHDRAEYSRKILRINEAIRSILSISHMERMDLIAINNRSLCNHSKIKRAERTTRKLNHKRNLPNLKDLRLDYRRQSVFSIEKRQNFSTEGIGSRLKVYTDRETELCEKYIEEYLQKLREEKRYDILGNRATLIAEACKEIMIKLEASKRQESPADKKQATIDESPREVRIPMYARKSRSITEMEYCEELARIRKSSEYSSKARALNERLFLRKIKQIKLHSQPE